MVLPPVSRRLLVWRSLAHRKSSESPRDFVVTAKQLNCNVQHVTKTRDHGLVAVVIICMSRNTNTNYHTSKCFRFFHKFSSWFCKIAWQNMCTHTARILQPYQLISQSCLGRNCTWCELFHLRDSWRTVVRHPWLLNLKRRLEYGNVVITSAVW